MFLNLWRLFLEKENWTLIVSPVWILFDFYYNTIPEALASLITLNVEIHHHFPLRKESQESEEASEGATPSRCRQCWYPGISVQDYIIQSLQQAIILQGMKLRSRDMTRLAKIICTVSCRSGLCPPVPWASRQHFCFYYLKPSNR